MTYDLFAFIETESTTVFIETESTTVFIETESTTVLGRAKDRIQCTS